MKCALLMAAATFCAGSALADPCKAIPDRGPMPPHLSKGQVFTGPASYVGDGDSLCVAVGQGAENWVEVRLEDFHAPELNGPGGREAKRALQAATQGKELSCRASHRSYDRIVATCWIGTASVGDLMRKSIDEGGNSYHRQ